MSAGMVNVITVSVSTPNLHSLSILPSLRLSKPRQTSDSAPLVATPPPPPPQLNFANIISSIYLPSPVLTLVLYVPSETSVVQQHREVLWRFLGELIDINLVRKEDLSRKIYALFKASSSIPAQSLWSFQTDHPSCSDSCSICLNCFSDAMF